jgi:hypothetical protein
MSPLAPRPPKSDVCDGVRVPHARFLSFREAWSAAQQISSPLFVHVVNNYTQCVRSMRLSAVKGAKVPSAPTCPEPSRIVR